MDSLGFKEYNLFAESDNENDAKAAEECARKRKRDLNDKELIENCAKNIKSINKESVEVCRTETSIKAKSKCIQTETLWSIEETLFYPLGIQSHYIVGVNKSVLIIWSELSVINFVIKKNPKTKQTKWTRVKLNVPNGEQIKNIKVLELNTLLLLESGRVNFFSSSKSMHTLPWLENVRCMAACRNGFSVIRLSADDKLLLEVYEDVVDMGKNATGPLKQSFDITFDEQNLFNCGWTDEHYFLLSTDINESNLKFLELVTRNTFDLDQQKELHFFAISGSVFLLIPGNDPATYNIEMLFSYSSNVAMMRLDFERNFCFIFLQCGIIDIWYMSSKFQNLRHETHCIGIEHISFSYSESRAALYFTDGNQVAEFKFSTVPESDGWTLLETYKAIPGVLACTWIEAIEQLVCLDCNNIFYQLTFEELQVEDRSVNSKEQPVIKTAEFEKFNTLFELTPQRVAQLLEKAHVIQQLDELPKVLHHEIEQQFRKQELLAVSSKRRYYSTFLTARLEFSCDILSLQNNNAVPLYTQNNCMLSQRSLHALIYVEIVENEIFNSSVWQLYLQYAGYNHIFTLSKSLLRNKLCFIVPLDMPFEKLLPEFRLHLYTFVSCAGRFVPIALPVSIVINEKTYAQLFALRKSSSTEYMRSQNNLKNLLDHFNRQSKSISAAEKICCLRVFKKIRLMSIFRNFENEIFSEEEDNIIEFNFLGSKIVLSYNSTNKTVSLKSNDAVALFYIKMHMQLAYEQQDDHEVNRRPENNNQKILQYQCNVERLYGTLENDDNNELNDKHRMGQKLNLLKELYQKIRKELFQAFFL